MAHTKSRSLWPKEHGAYGQLALPLVCALAMGRPGVASAALTCAAFATFVAHEPGLVLLGARGAWAREQHAARARRIGAAWLAAAVGCGTAGLVLGGGTVARAALVPVGIVLLLVPFVVRGAEKTLVGETVVAAGLSAAALPVAIAGDVSVSQALATWATWALAFGVTTAAVHCVLARHKKRSSVRALSSAAVLTAMAIFLMTRWSVVLAAVPMVLLAWFLIVRPPHARHLRRVGWTLLTCGVLTSVIAVLMVRNATPHNIPAGQEPAAILRAASICHGSTRPMPCTVYSVSTSRPEASSQLTNHVMDGIEASSGNTRSGTG